MTEPAQWAQVAVDRPVESLYTYRIPRPLIGRVLVGVRVRVPFGTGQAYGVVVSLGGAPPKDVEVKEITAVLDRESLFTPELLRLLTWVSDYYFCALGETLTACFPRSTAQAKVAMTVKAAVPVEVLSAELAKRAKRSPAQSRILSQIIGCPEGVERKTLLRSARAGSSSLRRLVEEGLLELLPEDPLCEVHPAEGHRPAEPTLTSAQREALSAIGRALSEGGFAPFVLFGVTGSGKTEVYLRALRQVLSGGGQGLVLLPEIALTPQIFGRFRQRLSGVAVLHSLLPAGQRLRTLALAKRGEVKVVIGPRSAVFTPFANLRLIVVDEEHETSFKSETPPRYHARDVALMRAKLRGIPVVLGSATPSVESYLRARSGQYQLLSLPERVTPHGLPQVRIVDLSRSAAGGSLLSRELLDLTSLVLSQGKQALFFLNRRGYARIVKCLRCGTVATCTQCSVALVYHRRGEILVCHTCGNVTPRSDVCPVCERPTVRYLGAGTERVLSELARRFPRARVRRLDRDAAASRRRLGEILNDFSSGKIDILVGTQMLAKGHDFPRVTLVGIICADTALHLPDFRAAERTFQLIHQVAGRAGRGEEHGVVVVQTFSPESKVVQLAIEGDFEGFAARELRNRRALQYPPFGRLARVVLKGRSEEPVLRWAKRVCDTLKGGEARVLGPAACPVERIRSQVRYHIVVKAASWRELHRTVALLASLRLPKAVGCAVDIDPVSFM